MAISVKKPFKAEDMFWISWSRLPHQFFPRCLRQICLFRLLVSALSLTPCSNLGAQRLRGMIRKMGGEGRGVGGMSPVLSGIDSVNSVCLNIY